MPDPMRVRKALFKAALTNAGITAKQWCERNDYSEGYLYQVFRDEVDGPPLIAKIDAFITKYLPAQPLAASA